MRSLTKSYWLPFMLIVVLAYGVVPVDAQSSEPEPPDKVLYLPAVNGPDLSPNDTIQVIDSIPSPIREWIAGESADG